MTFKDLSIYLEKLEKTTSRNDMVLQLADLFDKVSASDMQSVMYLLQGRVAPLYVPLEFGVADKMILRAIAKAFNTPESDVLKEFKKIGDVGEVTQILSEKHHKDSKSLSISHVFMELEKIAKTGGSGSVEVKIDTMADLLKSADPLSARYITRIPVGKLRLGFSDMTVIDALSWMLQGDKKLKPIIEGAYNIRPDLGVIGEMIKKDGIKGVEKIKPAVGTPILMARAERLSSGQEIVEKIGECAVEEKFDG